MSKSNTPKKSKRIKNTGPKSPVAIARGALYGSALKQVKCAIEKGYAIEAVALLESMISDRLEARSSHAWPSAESSNFIPLSRLADDLSKDINEPTEAKVIYSQVCEWAKVRNEAIHGMVKFSEIQHAQWDAKYQAAMQAAKDGLDLFSKLKAQTRKLNKPPRTRIAAQSAGVQARNLKEPA